MTQFETLKERLADCRYLKVQVQTGEAEFLGSSELVKAMVNSGPKTLIVVDAYAALRDFAALNGVGHQDREFTMGDIATISGQSYHNAYQWVADGALPAPQKEFGGHGSGENEQARWGYRSAYIAGLLGTLKRHGLRLRRLLAVARRDIETQLCSEVDSTHAPSERRL